MSMMSKKIHFLFYLIFLFPYPSVGNSEQNPHQTLGLGELYEKAISHLPGLEARKDEVGTFQEEISQAKGGFLPRISLDGSYQRQDKEASLKNRSSDSILKFHLQQPIFRGMAEYAALRMAEKNKLVADENVKSEELLIYQKIVELYYDILIAKKDHSILEEFHHLAEQRAADIKRRVGIGKSRRAELPASQTQVLNLENQLIAAKGKIRTLQETMKYWTGLEGDFDLQGPREKTFAFSLLPLDHYLTSVISRGDLKAAEGKVLVKQEGIQIQKAGHLPQVDLGANYYVKRTGALEKVDWDAALTVSLPLFEGGVTQSKIRESVLSHQREQKLFQDQKERAFGEIKVQYLKVTSLFEQLAAIKKSESMSRQTYEEQKRDYQFGLASHQDVLQAFNGLLESKRSLEQISLKVIQEREILEAKVGGPQQ